MATSWCFIYLTASLDMSQQHHGIWLPSRNLKKNLSRIMPSMKICVNKIQNPGKILLKSSVRFPEFSMTHVVKVLSQQCTINKVFSIMTQKMQASVYFFLELTGLLTGFFFKFIAFPWLSKTHTSISGLSRPGNKWH